MVNALVGGENDKAKEYLSQYFNEVGSKLISGQPQPTHPVNESYAFDVYKDGKIIDTVFYSGKNTTVEDIKKSLVDHDGYDSDIVVKKVRKSPSKKNQQKEV